MSPCSRTGESPRFPGNRIANLKTLEAPARLKVIGAQHRASGPLSAGDDLGIPESRLVLFLKLGVTVIQNSSLMKVLAAGSVLAAAGLAFAEQAGQLGGGKGPLTLVLVHQIRQSGPEQVRERGLPFGRQTPGPPATPESQLRHR